MWSEKIADIKNSQGLGTEPTGFYYDNDNLNWNGYGILGQTAKDFSMIDDTYYLHIDLMSNEAVAHIPLTIGIGNSSLTFGSYSTKALFADFGRDGEWYSFDIPVAWTPARPYADGRACAPERTNGSFRIRRMPM